MPLVIAGATSGSTTVQATDAVTATITLPSATTTLAGTTTPSFTTTIGVGGATPSASGAGITFPATQSASTNANTLDDYEEGTWTATMGTSTSGTITIGTANQGFYTKVGRVVTVCGQFNVASVSSPVGEWQILGLPFPNINAVGTSENYCSVSIFADGLAATAITAIEGYIAGNASTRIRMGKFSAGAFSGCAPSVQAGSYCFITVTYFTTT
jgi:hypothetical protein